MLTLTIRAPWSTTQSMAALTDAIILEVVLPDMSALAVCEAMCRMTTGSRFPIRAGR